MKPSTHKRMEKTTAWIDRATALKVDIPRIAANLELQERHHTILKTGMDAHPLNAEVKYITEEWVTKLKGDEIHFTFLLDHVLVPGYLQKVRMQFVEHFKHSGFINKIILNVAKHLKGELPSREELYEIEALRDKLASAQFYDPDLVKFIQKINAEVLDHLKQLRAKHPKSVALRELVTELKTDKEIIHLQKYIDEIHILQEAWKGVQYDDKNWTNLKKLFAEKEDFAKRIETRFGDEKYAKMFLAYMNYYKMYPPKISEFLKSIVDRLSTPSAMMEVEKKGVQKMMAVFDKLDKFLKSQLESLRKDLLKIANDRVQEIESGKKSIMKESEKTIQKELEYMHVIAGLGNLLGSAPKPEVLAEVNKVLAEPGKLKDGVAMLHDLLAEGKIGMYNFMTILLKLIEQREDFRKTAKKRIWYFYDVGDLGTERLKEIDELGQRINWYNKELLFLDTQVARLERKIKTIERYQSDQMKHLDRLLKSVKGLQQLRAMQEKAGATLH